MKAALRRIALLTGVSQLSLGRGSLERSPDSDEVGRLRKAAAL
jgi:hypothetical protein